jgi:hypothetical protein
MQRTVKALGLPPVSGVNYSFRSTTTIIPDSRLNFFLSSSGGDVVVAGRAGA